MEYSNTDQIGLSCMKLPEVCTPVYREIVKEIAEVIKDAQIRDIFTLFLLGKICRLFLKEQVFPLEIWHICIRKRAERSVWSGNLILSGSRNWITHMSDVEITNHFC